MGVASAAQVWSGTVGVMDEQSTTYTCPKCGSDDVSVTATVVIRLSDHDLDLSFGSGFTYDDDSDAVCRDCSHRDRLMSFDPDGRDVEVPEP